MKRTVFWTGMVVGIAAIAFGVYQFREAPSLVQNPTGVQQLTTSQSPQQNQPVLGESFAIRGVIEGFYGTPWSHEQRLDMFRFLAGQQFNTYVYAPKDDPYQRLQWAQLYPSQVAGQMQELVQAAEAQGVRFVYSISPGLPAPLDSQPITPEMERSAITFSSRADRNKLQAKLDQMRGYGVHTVMLSFDDIQDRLNQADRAVYGDDYAKAQFDLANELLKAQKQKDPNFELWFAPTVYDGLKDNPYWQKLREQLDPSVQVIWTGPNILSKTIQSSQADTVTGLLGRKPLIWDNFPVNDYTYEVKKRPALIMGPLEARDPDLHEHTAGFLANPMIQPQASKLSLATIGAFLSHPATYDPQQAWDEALTAVDGVHDVALFAHFSHYARTSFLHPANHPDFARLSEAFWQTRGPEQADVLRKELQEVQDLPAKLRGTITNQELLREIEPWLNKLGAEGETGLAALELALMPNSLPERGDALQKVKAQLQELRQNKLMIGEEIVEFIDKAVQGS